MIGNTDTSTVVTHTLMPPVYASKLRILPHSIHRRTVCIRVELRGCMLQSKSMCNTFPKRITTFYALNSAAPECLMKKGKMEGSIFPRSSDDKWREAAYFKSGSFIAEVRNRQIPSRIFRWFEVESLTKENRRNETEKIEFNVRYRNFNLYGWSHPHPHSAYENEII